MGSSVPGSSFCDPWPSCALPPREPPHGPLCDLLSAWPPDDPAMETRHGNSTARRGRGRGGQDPLPRFNFAHDGERAAAAAYREAELPFVVYGVPDVEDAKVLWTNAYLRAAFALMSNSGRGYKIERSTYKGHFLYYNHRGGGLRGGGGGGGGYKPPQIDERALTYADFERFADSAEEEDDREAAAAAAAASNAGAAEPAGAASTASPGSGRSTLYLTISASAGAGTQWVMDALRFFRDDHAFFRVNYPDRFHGVNCRFGMRGVVQAAHYDHGRNFIAMVKGHKRYVLLPPRACAGLALLGDGHPSRRHASFDWADPAARQRAPDGAQGGQGGQGFCNSPATELVLSPGDVLYLPSLWFHYIVSLDRSVQCNSRAGSSNENEAVIARCMAKKTVPSGAGY